MDVLDLSFMSDYTHWDRVLTHLGGHVLVHLKAQVPQNQVACGQKGTEISNNFFLKSSFYTHTHTDPHQWRCRQTGRGLWLVVSALQGLLGKSWAFPGRWAEEILMNHIQGCGNGWRVKSRKEHLLLVFRVGKRFVLLKFSALHLFFLLKLTHLCRIKHFFSHVEL